MCVKMTTSKMTPGSLFGFRASGGATSGKWGLFNGTQVNARSERLDTIWKDYLKGVIYVDSFWESGKEFKRSGGKNFAIGIIFNSQREFAVLTCPANEIVSPVHDRMPLIIADDAVDQWLQQGTIKQMTDLQEFSLLHAA